MERSSKRGAKPSSLFPTLPPAQAGVGDRGKRISDSSRGSVVKGISVGHEGEAGSRTPSKARTPVHGMHPEGLFSEPRVLTNTASLPFVGSMGSPLSTDVLLSPPRPAPLDREDKLGPGDLRSAWMSPVASVNTLGRQGRVRAGSRPDDEPPDSGRRSLEPLNLSVLCSAQ